MKLVKPSFSIMAMSGHDELPYSYESPYSLIEAAGRTCYKTEDKIGPGTAEAFVKMIEANGHLSVMEHSWGYRKYEWDEWIPKALVAAKSLLSCSPGMRHDFMYLSGNIRMFKEFDALSLMAHCKEISIQDFLLGVNEGRPKERFQGLSIYGNHFAATVRIICDRGVSHELVRHRLASYSQESTRYCNYSKKGNGHVSFIIPPWMMSIPQIYTGPTTGNTEEETDWLHAMAQLEKIYKALLVGGWSPQQARSVLPNSLKTEIVVTTNWAQWQHIFNMRSIGVAGKPHPQMLEIMQPLHQAFKEMEPKVFK